MDSLDKIYISQCINDYKFIMKKIKLLKNTKILDNVNSNILNKFVFIFYSNKQQLNLILAKKSTTLT